MIWFWKCKGWGHSTKTSKRSWVSWSEQSIITSLEFLIFTSYYSNHHIEVKLDYLLIIVLFIDMLSSKKKQNKLNRSRSRSISLQRSNNKLGHKQGKKGHPKSGRNQQKNLKQEYLHRNTTWRERLLKLQLLIVMKVRHRWSPLTTP